MKITHKRKVLMAKNMMSKKDKLWGRGIFDSIAWRERSLAIRKRIQKNNEKRNEK